MSSLWSQENGQHQLMLSPQGAHLLTSHSSTCPTLRWFLWTRGGMPSLNLESVLSLMARPGNTVLFGNRKCGGRLGQFPINICFSPQTWLQNQVTSQKHVSYYLCMCWQHLLCVRAQTGRGGVLSNTVSAVSLGAVPQACWRATAFLLTAGQGA